MRVCRKLSGGVLPSAGIESKRGRLGHIVIRQRPGHRLSRGEDWQWIAAGSQPPAPVRLIVARRWATIPPLGWVRVVRPVAFYRRRQQ